MSIIQKAIQWIQAVIAGSNKTGEIIHGILDAAPIPNQMLVKAGQAMLEGNPRRAAEILSEALTLRNWTALITSAVIAAGLLAPDQVGQIIEWLQQLISGMEAGS